MICSCSHDGLAGKKTHMPDCLVPITEQIKEEITAVIRWASESSPRSLQAIPGPSELGDPCDRRLAYRLAGSPVFNTMPDPLAAVVGTGLHSWLEQAILRYVQTFGDTTLVPETRLQIDPLIAGTSDLYHRDLQAVVDYKGASSDVIDEAAKNGPQPGYKVQAHLYGYGYEHAGLKVSYVSIIYIPRAGTLKGMYVWAEEYNPQIAIDALARMYRIGEDLLALGSRPDRFDAIPATPSSKSCWFCPYKAGSHLLSGVATPEHGCPGT